MDLEMALIKDNGAYFPQYWSEHRLWVLVRSTSNEYPRSMFLNRNKEIMYYLVNPTFFFFKWGSPGCSFHGLVNVMGWNP